MDFEVLRESWSAPRESLMKKQSIIVNESERNKFGETASLFLNPAQKQELIHPMLGRLNMPVHQRRRSPNAAAVSGADDISPLCGREFIARENVPHFVIENFSSSPRQCAQAVVAQHRQIITQAHPGEFN